LERGDGFEHTIKVISVITTLKAKSQKRFREWFAQLREGRKSEFAYYRRTRS